MAVDFSKLLSKQASTIEKPKAIPIGHYIAVNQKLPDFKGIGKNETPGAVFALVLIAPTEDVDQDQLKEYGEIKGKSVNYTQWLTEASEYRATQELCNAFDIEMGEKTLGQIYNETINKQILVEITHEPSQDGTEMFHRATAIAKA